MIDGEFAVLDTRIKWLEEDVRSWKEQYEYFRERAHKAEAELRELKRRGIVVNE
jgi:hypothetical protein